MRHLLISLFLLLFSGQFMIAQNGVTYDIHPSAEVDEDLLLDALKKCSFDPYRLPNERIELKFEDGTIVELYSAAELLAKGIQVNGAAVNQSGRKNTNVFILHPDGYILEKVKFLSKEEQAEKHSNNSGQ